MTIRKGLSDAAGRAWSVAKAKTKSASGEAKATTAGAVGGGVLASTAGAKVGIAAFGTAVSGAALLPVVATVGVGAIAGYAAYKVYKDVKAKRSQTETDARESAPMALLTDTQKDKS